MSEVKRYDITGDYWSYEDSCGEFVKYSDIEKMVKLFDIIKEKVDPECASKECFMNCPYHGVMPFCELFCESLDLSYDGNIRCPQCIDIFGGDV